MLTKFVRKEIYKHYAQNSCEKKRRRKKKQRRKGKIEASECRVPKNSKKR